MIMRRAVFISVVFLLFTLAFWLLVRAGLVYAAVHQADTLISAAIIKSPATDDDTKVIAISTEVFRAFEQKNPEDVPLLQVRRYLTHRYVPGFLRLPDGVIEMLIRQGYCDNAGRMLSLVLKRAGYDSVQWDMVFSDRAHSGLLVSMPGGRKVYVGAFYGYVMIDENGRLAHPETAQQRILNGVEFDDVFLPLRASGKANEPAFFQNFEHVLMAAKGEPLRLEFKIPSLDGDPVVLGTMNDSDADVQGTEIYIGPYWNYVGHKYSRGWTRILVVHEPVRIEMDLLAAPDHGVMTMEPRPVVEGKRLIWDLGPGDRLVFKDGEARMSWRRLNSYIGVDRIVLTPRT